MIKKPLDIEEEEGHGEPSRHGRTCQVDNGVDSIGGTVIIARAEL
jgi:hypothetical protein